MNNKPKSSDWIDPDDATPWTDADFAAAQYRIGGTVVTRAKAHAELAKRVRGSGKRQAKTSTTLLTPPDVLARQKATGFGWQHAWCRDYLLP